MLDHNTIYGRFIGNPISADLLFCDLHPKTKKSLASIKKKKRISKGRIIAEIGSSADWIFVHHSGQMELTFNHSLNQKSKSRLVEKKEIIGLTQMISNSPCQMSLKTLTPCFFEAIQYKDFINFLQAEPQICFRLAGLLSADIQQSYRTFTSSIY